MTEGTAQEAEEVIASLLRVAKLAMPDTYFETDSRVRKAQEWLKARGKQFATSGHLRRMS